jgi:methanogenic corrinoid protein MtbC1
MTEDRGDMGEPFRRARDVVRLQKALLPDRAVQLLADEVMTRLAGRLHPEDGPAPIAEEVAIDDFCQALIDDDAEVALGMVRRERRDGVPLETIYLGTLAGAAARLGQWWDEDRVSFLQMSMAAGRIFEIMRHLRQTIPEPRNEIAPERRALFATMPGDQHTMGVTMAADLFRNRGWDIDLRVGFDHDALMAAVAGRDYRVIGLSANNVEAVTPLARAVVAFRITHPGARIIVSGSLVAQMPGIGLLVGADGAAGDWAETLRVVTDLADGA